GANRLHYPLAVALRSLGRREEAELAFAAAGVVGVACPDPLMASVRELARGERVAVARGRIALAAQRLEEAELAFRTAIDVAPQSSPAYVALAATLVAGGRHDAALAVLVKLVQVVPG